MDMDMEFTDLQTIATFVSEVGEGKYYMAREDWLSRNYRNASAKLIVWLFNQVVSQLQTINELKETLEPQNQPAPEAIEEDDKH